MKIKIGLHTTNIVNHLPELDIKVDKKKLSTVILENENPIVLDFNEDFSDKNHFLKITFKNKTNDDTILAKTGEIIMSVSVTIDFIEFEDIDISSMLFSHSKFIPDYPEPWYSQQDPKPEKSIKNCLDMGWNGTFELKFKCPIFEWFLENL